MSWTFVPLERVAAQPWRNGGGVTRELLAWPGSGHWQVRISVAEVASDGPFSRYEGIERWFAVLQGDGVVLRLPGQAHRLTPASEPLRFDGGEPVACSLLGGPTRDFNVMAAPGRARLQRVRGSLPVVSTAPALVAVYAHAHGAQLTFGSDIVDVPAGQFAWRRQDRPLTGTVRGQDALWMEAAL